MARSEHSACGKGKFRGASSTILEPSERRELFNGYSAHGAGSGAEVKRGIERLS